MKILWVVRPAEGGILQHLQQLSEGIPDLDILIAAPPTLKEWAGRRPFFSLDLVDGLEFKHDLASIGQLRRVIRKERAQIVHAHGFKAALITALALAPVRRAHFVFTAHNALPSSGGSPFRRWGYDFVQRRLFTEMDTIISVSDAVRSQIVRFVPERKVLTIYNGISPSKFGGFSAPETRIELGLGSDAQIVGTVARLIPGKGMDTLLEAVSLVAKILPNLQLVIVGEGTERQRLEKYAAGLGLDDRVHFLGWREDVPRLLASWDCFTLPTLSEGFSLSVLEAMASRLPVVVSDLPALREAVVPGKSGFMFQPGNAPELAAGLLQILKAPDKARAMGEFNRERVHTYFGDERMVRCTRALYEGFQL